MFDQFVRVPDAIEFMRKPIFARVLAAIGALIFRAGDHLMKAHGYIEDGLEESQTRSLTTIVFDCQGAWLALADRATTEGKSIEFTQAENILASNTTTKTTPSPCTWDAQLAH